MSPQAETLPASLVFELEDEGAALIGHSSEEDEDTKPAAHHMPLWALPLLFIAVRTSTMSPFSFETVKFDLSGGQIKWRDLLLPAFAMYLGVLIIEAHC